MEFMMTFKMQLLNKNHPHIKKLFWLEKTIAHMMIFLTWINWLLLVQQSYLPI